VIPAPSGRRVLAAGLGIVMLAFSLGAAAAQLTYKTPADAFTALIAAARAEDSKALLAVLGPEGESFVVSEDPVADKQALERFVAAYDAANHIEMTGKDKATLVVGKEEWPFPVPAVKKGASWHLDAAAGKEEILDRRIGRDELAVLEVCQAYVDAQREYASKDRNADGYIEYAQKFLSSPGAHDGLYWPTKEGEEESPLGPLVVEAQAAGYTLGKEHEAPTPYYGYYYRILKGQGPHAKGGAYDYVINGHMIGGFAMVAFPAQYGVTGIMTFIVNHDGVIYEKDLGPDTEALAEKMKLFDPGPGWTRQEPSGSPD
jgi:Protein of unknown function (DUF2950)